jgi:hypothetical protein
MDKKAADLRRLTAVLLGGAAVLLGVYDVVVAYNDVQGDTISELVRDLSHSWYLLPYLFGVVTGHFFWNRPAEELPPREQRLVTLFAVVGGSFSVLLLRDLANAVFPLPAFSYANLVLVTGGFFVGAKFWPQHLPTKEEQPNG